jgi:hypothetical protein
MADIDEILTRAVTNGNRFAEDADRAVGAAISATNGGITLRPPQIGEPGEIPEIDLEFEIPIFTGTYEAPANNVVRPSFEEIHNIKDTRYPSRPNISTDLLFLQRAPSTSAIGTFNRDAPTVDIEGLQDDIDGFQKPDLQAIEDPVLTGVELRTVPSVDLPEFQQSVVLTQPGAIGDVTGAFKQGYDDILPGMQGFIDDRINQWYLEYAPDLKQCITVLTTKLKGDIENGTGISADFETNLYNRARSQARLEGVRVQQELEKGTARRGFSLPSGTLSAGRVQIHQREADAIARQAGEIAIERARMEIQHTQFAMGLLQSYTTAMTNSALQYAGIVVGINNQSLEYARELARTLVQIQDSNLANAKLNIDILNAESRIYETELKAALSIYEQYKIELETAKLTLDIDDQKIDIFTKRIDSQTVKISQYVALLDSVAKKAAIEKLKTELFGEELKVYLANLSGVETELNIYEAQLRGDDSKLKGQLAKLDVYNKDVEIANQQQQLKIEQIKLTASLNNNRATIYNADIQEFQSRLKAASTTFDSDIKGHQEELKTVVTDLAVKREVFKSQFDAIIARGKTNRDQLSSDVERLKATAGIFLTRMQAQAQTGIAAAEVFAGMARAQMDSQNVMVSEITQQQGK